MSKTTFNNPDSQEREYTRLLLGYSKALQVDINRTLIPQLDNLKAQFDMEMRSDGWAGSLDALMSELILRALQGAGVITLRLPSQFASVSKFNEKQFKKVVKNGTGFAVPDVLVGAPARISLGVNVFRSEPYLRPLAEGWVGENTSLIKSLPTRLHPEVEGIVRRGVMNGASVKQIAKDIKARYPVTNNRATLIAQDQTLKLNADLTRYRLQSIGIDRFIWRTVGDNRVRPDHADLEGREFSWDKPHPTEGLPASQVRCRCRAEAIFDDDE